MNSNNNIIPKLQLTLTYNINSKFNYIPFVLIPNINNIGIYNITIYTNLNKNNCKINLNISVLSNPLKILLINYEIINDISSNIRYISDIYIDTDNNYLVIWLKNNMEYISTNLMENMIIYPDCTNININSLLFTYLLTLDNQNQIKNNLDFLLYENIINTNFNLIYYNSTDSIDKVDPVNQVDSIDQLDIIDPVIPVISVIPVDPVIQINSIINNNQIEVFNRIAKYNQNKIISQYIHHNKTTNNIFHEKLNNILIYRQLINDIKFDDQN